MNGVVKQRNWSYAIDGYSGFNEKIKYESYYMNYMKIKLSKSSLILKCNETLSKKEIRQEFSKNVVSIFGAHGVRTEEQENDLVIEILGYNHVQILDFGDVTELLNFCHKNIEYALDDTEIVAVDIDICFKMKRS